ncbi:hypothetical protein TNCV_1122351 [Trichonephila clavipes]|nr:hypothetical protein TNCV_1122351 [Trichonephila clavipes]
MEYALPLLQWLLPTVSLYSTPDCPTVLENGRLCPQDAAANVKTDRNTKELCLACMVYVASNPTSRCRASRCLPAFKYTLEIISTTIPPDTGKIFLLFSVCFATEPTDSSDADQPPSRLVLL